jgi:hypothetical protein
MTKLTREIARKNLQIPCWPAEINGHVGIIEDGAEDAVGYLLRHCDERRPCEEGILRESRYNKELEYKSGKILCEVYT